MAVLLFSLVLVFLRWWLGPSVSSKWMTISSVLVTDESSSSPPLSGIARASKVLNIGTDVDMLIVLFGAVAFGGSPRLLLDTSRPVPVMCVDCLFLNIRGDTDSLSSISSEFFSCFSFSIHTSLLSTFGTCK